MRGELDNSKTIESLTSEDEEDYMPLPIEPTKKIESKWSEFIERDEVTATKNEDNDVMLLENKEVVLEIPKKTHKKKSITNLKYYKEHQEIPEQLNLKTDTNQENNNIECNIINQIPTEIKYQSKFKGPAYQQQKRIKQSDYDNIENTIINFTSQNESKELHEPKKLKFVSPIINSNSKWAKFVDYGNDEQYDISKTETLSSNVLDIKGLESDSIDVSTRNGYMNQINRKNNEEIDKRKKSNNFIESKFDLRDHTISRHNRNIDTNANEEKHSNKSVNCKNNYNLDINDIFKTQNVSQRKNNNLFSLCEDDEIDNVLEF
ncbi:unnamed protein product [Diatraea saccharalis]|uniref:Uncharacterized protein n=1 Tax=Diatraea saccharalis TaxID=40085 RepID=A0A9N9N2P4_9NEOP|nr:unnamed protein product [Diatraea saccharalis]